MVRDGEYAYARYKQRQETRAAALLRSEDEVGSSLGRVLALQSTTFFDDVFQDLVD